MKPKKNDRYSLVYTLLIFSFVLFLYFTTRNKLIAALPIIASFLYLMFLAFISSGKIHLTDEQKKSVSKTGFLPNKPSSNKLGPYLQFKPEEGCGFTDTIHEKADGISLDNTRFKLINGLDVYINENYEVKTLGLGSRMMLYFSNGGYEPKIIQGDNSWKLENNTNLKKY